MKLLSSDFTIILLPFWSLQRHWKVVEWIGGIWMTMLENMFKVLEKTVCLCSLSVSLRPSQLVLRMSLRIFTTIFSIVILFVCVDANIEISGDYLFFRSKVDGKQMDFEMYYSQKGECFRDLYGRYIVFYRNEDTGDLEEVSIFSTIERESEVWYFMLPSASMHKFPEIQFSRSPPSTASREVCLSVYYYSVFCSSSTRDPHIRIFTTILSVLSILSSWIPDFFLVSYSIHWSPPLLYLPVFFRLGIRMLWISLRRWWNFILLKVEISLLLFVGIWQSSGEKWRPVGFRTVFFFPLGCSRFTPELSYIIVRSLAVSPCFTRRNGYRDPSESEIRALYEAYAEEYVWKLFSLTLIPPFIFDLFDHVFLFLFFLLFVSFFVSLLFSLHRSSPPLSFYFSLLFWCRCLPFLLLLPVRQAQFLVLSLESRSEYVAYLLLHISCISTALWRFFFIRLGFYMYSVFSFHSVSLFFFFSGVVGCVIVWLCDWVVGWLMNAFIS